MKKNSVKVESAIDLATVESTIQWLEECNETETCKDCRRLKENLCMSAQRPIVKALEVLRVLRDELAGARAEKKPEKVQDDSVNDSVNDSESDSKVIKVVMVAEQVYAPTKGRKKKTDIKNIC